MKRANGPIVVVAAGGDLVGLLTPAVVTAGFGYALHTVNTVVTQRAETRREQIRQDGETLRAIIAPQAPPNPPESQEQ